MLSTIALTLSLSIPFIPSIAAYSKPVRHVHNFHNPHASQFKREVTADTSNIADASFDFVIVGGGCAGLAIASRLSEWSNVTVLVIEAGGDGSDVEAQIDIPGYSYLHSLTGSAYDWAYNTVAQTDSGGGTKYWPRGKGLGGSGAINGLFWCRGAQSEYDAWATLNPGGEQTWNWEEVSKYINKAENFSQPNSSVQDYFGMVLDSSVHGSGGPIQAGFSEYIFDSVKNWIPAWVGLGFTAHDLADGNTRGVMITPSTLNMRNQSRSDSKAGYIDPLPPRSNLVILTGQQVTEVLFNGTKDASGNVMASGVKFQASSSATSYSVQANREVILAGGSIGSPQILQLSGIGPSSTLTGLGIDVVLDLPVGYNLQDHQSYSMYWSTPQGTLTWANLSYTNELGQEQLQIYDQSATGMWTYINEAVGYVSMSDISGGSSAAQSYQANVQSEMNTTVSDVTSWLDLPDSVATGLAAQYALQAEWLTTDVGQLEIILTMLGQGDNTLGIQVALQHPWSRGNILITSTSAFTAPAINPDYFGVGYDIDIMNYGSEFARKLAAAAPLSEVMLTETLPGATVTGDALGNYTKTNCGTEYHPIGTCSMLPKNSGGVVDTNLIVYGTNNLRVIDASIAPIHMSSHTMAIAYGIAEKGADIVKSRWMAVVAETNTTTNATVASTSTATASAGVATDTAVTGANDKNGASSSSDLSLGAKIGIGAGVGVGGLAVLAALLAFCLVRRKRKNEDAAAAANMQKLYRRPGGSGRGYSDGAYKEAAEGAYPLATLPTPAAPFSHGGHQRDRSVGSMDTLELYGAQPMRSESGYGLANYDRGGASSPYR
ncbi:GMC oxidoreductase-domain-containing protein [Naematelia encephala]|uniref:GMC oxidoreductase-domain-containing protein n=1 Tax=Naematelia encephala TaxID=71784 RepID=A0A1Y2AZV6_9TREE|nr:GMC oxidoreductase-domain-containing protein [Naematelia encephala]